MPAIYLTPEQDKKRSELSLAAGLKGAAIGFGLGAVATVLTLRRSPSFRALSRPWHSTFVVSGTTAGYLFASDRASTAYENAVLGYTDELMVEELQNGKPAVQPVTLTDKALHYLNENRWTVIGLSWLASMGGALAYSFSNRYLTTQQKVVQARMYAQAVTLAVLMASAGLSIYMGDDDKKKKEEPDAQLRAILELPVEQNKIVRPQ